MELRAARVEHERRESLRQAMVLGGSAGALLAAFLSGGSLWPNLAASVAEGLSLAAASIPTDATQTIEFRGTTAEDLLDELVDGFAVIDGRIEEESAHLEGLVNDAVARVEHLRGGPDGDDGRLVPVRPDIVDGVDAESFYIP